MALAKLVSLCLVGVGAGQLAGTLLETTTPVPILRFIDSQNEDGSYTYGFEGGDGTYKIETRLADGQVRGKYGYYDPEGVLREASYGATSEGGFEPQIKGLVLPARPAVDPRNYEVSRPAVPARAGSPRSFSNFSPRRAAGEAKADHSRQNSKNVKIVNGRRAVLKRRLVKRPPVARPEEVVRGASREAVRGRSREAQRGSSREEQLAQLRQQRRQLAQLQRDQSESFRSLPAARAKALVAPTEPYITYGSELGSYSISY